MITLRMDMDGDYSTKLHAPNLNALIEKVKDWHGWEDTKKSLLSFNKDPSIIEREKKSGWYYHMCGTECILVNAEDVFSFIVSKYAIRINILYNIFRIPINKKSVSTFIATDNIKNINIDDIMLMSHEEAMNTFMSMYFIKNNFIKDKVVLLDCRNI